MYFVSKLKIAVKVSWGDEELQLQWDNRKVTPVTSSEVLRAEWSYLQSRGLYGKYGHRVDLENCRFTDLAIAVETLVGVPNVTLDKEAKGQIQREVLEEERNPVPIGAQS